MSIESLRRWFHPLAASVIFASTALSHPGSGIVVDAKGQVYLVHGIRDRVLRMESNGTLTTFVQGTQGKALSNPHHLVLDKEGNLYTVGDRDGRVCKVTLDGKLSQKGGTLSWSQRVGG